MCFPWVYYLPQSISNHISNMNRKKNIEATKKQHALEKSNWEASGTMEKPEQVSTKTMVRNLNFICEVNRLLLLCVCLLIGKCVYVIEVMSMHGYYQGQMSLQAVT